MPSLTKFLSNDDIFVSVLNVELFGTRFDKAISIYYDWNLCKLNTPDAESKRNVSFMGDMSVCTRQCVDAPNNFFRNKWLIDRLNFRWQSIKE